MLQELELLSRLVSHSSHDIEVEAQGLLISQGGAALLMMGGMALSATYGVGRAGYRLRDRAHHSETINPFKSRDAFWVWLGIGADVVTFGTIGAASTHILSSISQSAAFVELSKKFAAATRVVNLKFLDSLNFI